MQQLIWRWKAAAISSLMAQCVLLSSAVTVAKNHSSPLCGVLLKELNARTPQQTGSVHILSGLRCSEHLNSTQHMRI